TLGSDGLIGNSIISLVGGSAETPQVQEGDVIKTGASVGMEQMMGMLQENGANLSVITTNFAKLSQQMVDGKGIIGALMTDDAIANNLKTSVASMNKVMSDANLAVNNLVTLTQKLNSNQGLIHDLTTDTKVF